jgi:hypothetical protein
MIGLTGRRTRIPGWIQKDRYRKTEIILIASSHLRPGKSVVSAALPCLPATDAAAFEEAAIAVFDNHIVPSQRMAELAKFELCADDRPCTR